MSWWRFNWELLSILINKQCSQDKVIIFEALKLDRQLTCLVFWTLFLSSLYSRKSPERFASLEAWFDVSFASLLNFSLPYHTKHIFQNKSHFDWIIWFLYAYGYCKDIFLSSKCYLSDSFQQFPSHICRF